MATRTQITYKQNNILNNDIGKITYEDIFLIVYL